MARQFSHAILELLRTPAGTACLILIAVATVGFGTWLIGTRRLPDWMRGPLYWPLGDIRTPQIAQIYGWAGVAAGIGLVVVTWAIHVSPTAGRYELFGLAAVLACASAILTAKSIVVSRRPS